MAEMSLKQEDVPMEENSGESPENKENKNKMRYEYYIHYLGLDRRMDRWVSEHYLKVDPEEMSLLEGKFNQKEEDKKNQDQTDRDKKYLYNDENHGMTDKDVV